MIETLAQFGNMLLYPAVALIAYFDTLIGVGFFVFGEIAFVTAGVRWAATGDIWIVILVLCAACSGDLTSFGLGRRYGARAASRCLKPLSRRRQWRRARRLLMRYGIGFVIVARLLGPVAWITPFLAGSLAMPARRFALATVPAVLIGAGQFVLLGYFGANAGPLLQRAYAFLSDHMGIFAMGFAIFCATGVIWKMQRGGRLVQLLCAVITAAAIVLGANLYYFFASGAHAATSLEGQPQTVGLCDLKTMDLRVYPGNTNMHLPQPINVLLISDVSPEVVMSGLGWQQNMTFSRDRIGLKTYVELLVKRTPPVSEMYYFGQPAQSAFQLPGSLTERVHIRWWPAGWLGDQQIYVGAISRDEEIAIKYYRAIPALLHDIEPEVDRVRDLLAAQIVGHSELSVLGLAPLQKPVHDGQESDYQTDGRLLVVGSSYRSLLPQYYNCLSLTQNGEV
ncbi:LssY C-terminal domain-containing protein [Parasedimentitalea psychrophila]|uniref:LssY C-terminal domain-containing protein n=1 Tax=Parasedimentitalea psychrophila TaxID=2997337 RepID=A0A9Y2L519_9RHOB|nr:LssY C-terminal domain-containing protein [Parasedimentitalea psychrophila]WIY27786.1 LssY C-terminal domain-containing protein [Parasedimentitalea psychrophila]